MAEKTNFSDLVANEDQVTLPEKCCGRCDHGRKMVDQGQLGRIMFQCRALPPVPLLVMKGGQAMVQATWPVMDAQSDCDVFLPRREHNSPS